jgi:uncharacterized SAM-binding protein YcdF (DUF218 family)
VPHVRSSAPRWRAVTAAVGALFAILTAFLFVFPAKGSATHADAVVVLDDAVGVRRAKAIQAVTAGVAPNLVISHHADRPQDCPANIANVTVVCFSPTDDSTKGEAAGFARIAKEHGWTSLIFVTDPPHVARSKWLISRCFPGKLGAITTRVSTIDWPIRVVYEWAALSKAVLTQRYC